MQFISEEVIYGVVEELGSDESRLSASLKALETQQPVLTSYLFSEQTEVFTTAEKNWLLFAGLTIFESIIKVAPDSEPVPDTLIANAEERNWEMMQAARGSTFKNKLDPFFKNYQQEDLLAFVEDTLLDDEEELEITPEGREALFVMLKTIIDVLAGQR